MNRNHIRPCMRVRLHHKPKPNNYTESCMVNVTDRWRESPMSDGAFDIGVTLNTYTHLGLEDAADELKRMEELV
ncbi:hypothetical protein [Murimonas intestini]|nr:hypothetical protein [Murimonas intestini]MCR1843266.1 hypothetical protein [Murimonas intestini]